MTNKERFVQLLTSTHREGVDNVLNGLERLGFFEAPASTKHHLAEKGGLLRHSLNVYDQAMLIREMEIALKPELEAMVTQESIVITSLLHDVCKAEIYQEELKHRKLKTGKWEDYMGYQADYHHFPFGHGEKSVFRLMRLKLEITNDEALAIRWHMGPWDLSDSPDAKGNFNAACDQCPLLSILMAADGLATRISEVDWTKGKEKSVAVQNGDAVAATGTDQQAPAQETKPAEPENKEKPANAASGQ